ATVSDAALSATGTNIASTEGSAFSGPVATFHDGNLAAPTADFTATITWGDGNTRDRTSAAQGRGDFAVSGSNTYAEEDSYTVSVFISDEGGSTASSTSTATVSDAALSATRTNIASTEGSAFSGPVATFHDGNLAAPTADFTATITWGDGNT